MMNLQQMKQILHEACKRGDLNPNVFEGQPGKWENLNEADAGQFLKNVPVEKLKSIQKDLGIGVDAPAMDAPEQEKAVEQPKAPEKTPEQTKEPVKGALAPDDPASDKQRIMLREACRRGWLNPNPFESDPEKLKNLTAGEADKMLSGLSKDRLGALEEFANTHQNEKSQGKPMTGHTIESVFRSLGGIMDQGM